MRKIIFIIIGVIVALVVAILTFEKCENEKEPHIKFLKDPEGNPYVTSNKNYKCRSMDEINRKLDSLTALGCALIIRGSDREYDTIIDHVCYRYIKKVN